MKSYFLLILSSVLFCIASCSQIPSFPEPRATKPLAVNVIDFSSVTFEPDAATQGVTNIGNAPMQNGIAFIPVTFTSSDPKSIKLALKHRGLKVSSSASAASMKPDARVKPRLIVVVVAYEVIAVGVAAVAFIGPKILDVLSKQRGALLPEIDFSGITSWFAEAGNKVQAAVATVTNYVTVAIHANGNASNITDDAPFAISDPLDLSKPLGPCSGTTWNPPTGSALDALKNALNNRQQSKPPTFSENSLENLVQNLFNYDSNGAVINKLRAIPNEIAESIAKNLPWISKMAQALILSPGKANAKEPANTRIIKHAKNIRNVANGIKTAIEKRGKRNGQPGQPLYTCYSNDDLDLLYALYDLINDLLKLFDRGW